MRFLVLFLALWVVAAPAHAEPAGDDYGTVIRRAVTEYQAGAWEEARALFRQAHAMEPSARTLRGLALTAYELHHYVDCVLEFEEALGHAVRPLDATQRAEAERLLARARVFVARYTLQLAPAGAELTIDGAPPVMRDGKVLLDPGAHTLVAQAAGHKQIHLQLSVDAGSERVLRIDLESSAPTPVAALPPPALVPVERPIADPTPTPERPRARPYVWTFGAAGVASALTGGALWFVARDKSQDVKRCQATDPDCTAERSSGQRLERAAYALVGLGAALGGTALTLHLVSKRHRSGLSAGLGPTRVWLGARF